MTKMGRRFTALMLVLLLLLPQSVFAGLPERKEPGGLPEGAYRKDEVIIKFRPGYSKASAFAGKHKLTIVKSDAKLGYLLAKTPQATNLSKLFSALGKDPNVQYIQPNFIYQPFKTYNDAQYSRQWALKKINIEKGWDITTGNPSIVVAVLDTGVDNRHPDLQGKLVAGTNTVNPLRSTRDDYGHGTHVAGIIAANANNGIGIAGIANVKVMPVKVFDENYGGSDSSISDGIIWAADHGARVINMSFGSFYQSPLLNDAIEYARDKGVVMVAAAGNWASQSISYPAALSDVIAVSATNSKDELSEFSSYGPEIDVCAPGEDIFSTYWDPFKGSSYREESGTSMASPMVAGLAALLLSKNPKLTAEEVRDIIEASATDLGEKGWDPKFGHGRIDVYKALTTSLVRTDRENNTQDKAVPVTPGKAVTGKIDYGSDTDWYRVSVPARGALQVAVDPAGLVSPAVEIYDEAGTQLAAFNSIENSAGSSGEDGAGNEFGDFNFSGASILVAETVYGLVPDLDEGNYFIKVFGNHNRWSKENYRLTASVFTEQETVKDKYEPNESMEEAKSISLSEPVTGALIGQQDTDWYKVTLDSDRFYRLEVEVPPGLDIAVAVTKQEEEIDFESMDEEALANYEYFDEFIDNAGQGEKESGVFKTTKSGSNTYYIQVFDKYGASVNAGYKLSIKGYTPPADRNEPNDTWEQATSVQVGEKVYANFSDEADEDWYRIDVENKGLLEIRVDGKAYPELMIYQDPEGEPTGYYSQMDFFGEKGQEDKPMIVKVSPGTYYLAATGGYEAHYDEYSLEFKFQTFNFVDNEDNDTPSKANPLVIGTVQQGTLYPDGDVDFYVVDVVKPEPILVYLTPPKDLDTAVAVMKEADPEEAGKGKGKQGDSGSEKEELLPGDGTGPMEPDLDYISEINSGGEGQPDVGVFVPRKPGRYYIAVMNYLGTSSKGTYSLSLKPFKALPDKWEDNSTMQKAKAIGRGVAIQPTYMGIEDVDWFKVYVPSATWLNVNLKVPSDIDGVVEIFNSSGKWLGKFDYAMTGEEEAGSVRITKAGWYYIKTYDYLGNSSVLPYTLTVNWTEPAKKK